MLAAAGFPARRWRLYDTGGDKANLTSRLGINVKRCPELHIAPPFPPFSPLLPFIRVERNAFFGVIALHSTVWTLPHDPPLRGVSTPGHPLVGGPFQHRSQHHHFIVKHPEFLIFNQCDPVGAKTACFPKKKRRRKRRKSLESSFFSFQDLSFASGTFTSEDTFFAGKVSFDVHSVIPFTLQG